MDTRRAVEEFEPGLIPSSAELDGITIVIDPLGGEAENADERQSNDLALLIGGYLFHLVRTAGGIPIMTRADDRRRLGTRPGSAPQPVAGDELASADLLVAIDAAPSRPGDRASGVQVGVRGLSQDALPQFLARSLAAALQLDEAGDLPAEPLEGLSSPGACGVLVVLPCHDDRAAAADDPMLPCRWAEPIFQGIATFVDTHRAALRKARDARSAQGIVPARHPVPRFIDRAPDEELAALVRRVWPAGKFPVDKAAWFCQMCVAFGVSDHTFTYLQPEIEVHGETVVVGGATNMACLQKTLADALHLAGVKDPRNEMRLLPEDGRLDDARFGVCVAPMALTYAQPHETSGLRTQLLYGEPVWFLDREAGYLLVHADDGYWGWVHEACIRTMPPDGFAQYHRADRAVLLRDLESAGRRIVRGASLPVVSKHATQVELIDPDGVTIRVAEENVRIVGKPRDAEDRLNAALALLHRPYVYGGVSPLGLDCSGLVRSVFQQFGPCIGRDAAEQSVAGRLVATRWCRDGIRPGDLLFFVNRCGRIYHVGIALTATHFVHSAPPAVQITSLQEGDRLYCPHREAAFLAARRL